MGYNTAAFLALWVTTKMFSPLYPLTERLFFVVGYNRRGFPPLWNTNGEQS
jgi:hypothetical protein